MLLYTYSLFPVFLIITRTWIRRFISGIVICKGFIREGPQFRQPDFFLQQQLLQHLRLWNQLNSAPSGWVGFNVMSSRTMWKTLWFFIQTKLWFYFFPWNQLGHNFAIQLDASFLCFLCGKLITKIFHLKISHLLGTRVDLELCLRSAAVDVSSFSCVIVLS